MTDQIKPQSATAEARTKSGGRNKKDIVTEADGTKKDLSHLPKPEEKTSLLHWQHLGIIMHELFGLSYKEVAERIRGGKGKDTLQRVANSPAGKALREQLQDKLTDTDWLVKNLLKSNEIEAVVDEALAREMARRAGDYKQLHAMNKNIGLHRILQQQASPKSTDQQPTIVLQINGSAGTAEILEEHPNEVSYELLESVNQEDD